MALLHYRRTFVEKLFTVHAKVERMQIDGTPVGRDYERQYDTLFYGAYPSFDDVLAGLEEIRAWL